MELAVDQVENEALKLRGDLIERGELPPRFETALHTWDDLRDHFSQIIVVAWLLTFLLMIYVL
jgi:hypothetical protein